MEIPLDLSRHCVETEIRKRYHQVLAACLKPGAGRPELEAQLELLKRALEAFDFPRLRGRHPGLCGGSPQPVALCEKPGGEPQLRLGDGSAVPSPETGK